MNNLHVVTDLENLTKNSIKSLVESTDNFIVFPHEWKHRSEQIRAHIRSYDDSEATKFHARKCIVKLVDSGTLKSFCNKYHIQGSNKLSAIAWGIFSDEDLLGILSLGRHHRQGHNNEMILDRLCFKHGVRVQGGASKLFTIAKKWAEENGANKIISFSDNRFTNGKVYEHLNFVCERSLYPDYFYVKKDDHTCYVSKQSQKKSNTGCPADIKERDWASMQGLLRVYDGGKKRWVYNLKSTGKTIARTKSDPVTKKCPHCKEILGVENFTRDKSKFDGYCRLCKKCRTKKRK